MNYETTDLESFQQWVNELSDAERAMLDVLDAYFSSRSNLPGRNLFNNSPMAQDDKSTQEIIDDLSDMCDIKHEIVVEYMRQNGFSLVPTASGRLKWAIWRNLHAFMNAEASD